MHMFLLLSRSGIEFIPGATIVTLPSLQNTGHLGAEPFQTDIDNLLKLEISCELSCDAVFGNDSETVTYLGVRFLRDLVWVGIDRIRNNESVNPQVSCEYCLQNE